MIERAELHDAASKAFPVDQLLSDRNASWQLISEMGWLMIELPEDAGGLGLGIDSSAAILFELGRSMPAAPIIPALTSIRAINAAANFADKATWLERLCVGEYVAISMTNSTVSRDANGVISGTLSGVSDADMASHIFVTGTDFHAFVATDAAGITITERSLWDKSRRFFDVTFEAVQPEANLVVAEGADAEIVTQAIQQGLLVYLSADSLGGASATLDMTVEYLKTRKQFDRPLAMFQALKHRCADMKVHIAGAEALFWSRLANQNSSTDDLGAVKALCSDAYRLVMEDSVQLHGGIGLTDEHQCHLYMKRSLLNLQLAGNVDYWRERAGRQAFAAYAA